MATPRPDPHGASLKLPGDISKNSQRRNVKDPSRACTTQNPRTPEHGGLPWETNWGRETDGEGIQSGSWLKGHQELEVGWKGASCVGLTCFHPIWCLSPAWLLSTELLPPLFVGSGDLKGEHDHWVRLPQSPYLRTQYRGAMWSCFPQPLPAH